MLKSSLVILLSIYTSILFGQTTTVQPTTVMPENVSEMNGFMDLSNALYKLEMASFNKIATLIEYKGKADVLAIPVLEASDMAIVFADDNAKLSIKKQAFDSNKHEYKYIDPEAPFLVKIDSKPFYGTDGMLPSHEIKEMGFEFNSKQISIPAEAYNDLFEPVLCNPELDFDNCNCRAFRSKDRERIYLYMRNGEGTAAYEVTWIFEKGVYKQRVVDYIY